MTEYVECNKCWTKFNANNVELESAGKGYLGRDMVVWKCPACGKTVETPLWGDKDV